MLERAPTLKCFIKIRLFQWQLISTEFQVILKKYLMTEQQNWVCDRCHTNNYGSHTSSSGCVHCKKRTLCINCVGRPANLSDDWSPLCADCYTDERCEQYWYDRLDTRTGAMKKWDAPKCERCFTAQKRQSDLVGCYICLRPMCVNCICMCSVDKPFFGWCKGCVQKK